MISNLALSALTFIFLQKYETLRVMRTTNSHLNDMLYDLTPDNCDVCGCDDDEDDFEDGGDDNDDIEKHTERSARRHDCRFLDQPPN